MALPRPRVTCRRYIEFTCSLSVKGRTMSWEAHERDHHFGQNTSIDMGKNSTLRQEGNARINQVSPMRPGLAKTIEEQRTS
jgi:hypothetical protein